MHSVYFERFSDMECYLFYDISLIIFLIPLPLLSLTEASDLTVFNISTFFKKGFSYSFYYFSFLGINFSFFLTGVLRTVHTSF
jgi:hypothetical protein